MKGKLVINNNIIEEVNSFWRLGYTAATNNREI
jgi:hypothetical protein